MTITNKDNYILGIESSCDDTSAAILKNDILLSNITAGQSIHEEYGGVVPELASRAHQQNIIPVVDAAIKKAGIDKSQISAIAFTRGPGLLGSLLVGTSFAKSLAMGLNIPLIDVNHMKGHVLAHFIRNSEEDESPEFPFLCMTISGGHTQIVMVRSPNEMEVIGETIDDAAGEAFDKAAKILGLTYPGGPLIDKYAKQGNPDAFSFTFPKVGGDDYSFSGLKTQFMNFVRNNQQKNPSFIDENLKDICASYQRHIVSYLLKKFEPVIKRTGVKEIAVAGGVSANSEVRRRFSRLSIKHGVKVHIPEFQFCTDNAAMIAMTGYFKYLNKDFAEQDVSASARLKISFT